MSTLNELAAHVAEQQPSEADALVYCTDNVNFDSRQCKRARQIGLQTAAGTFSLHGQEQHEMQGYLQHDANTKTLTTLCSLSLLCN
jgi:hypothetical protein